MKLAILGVLSLALVIEGVDAISPSTGPGPFSNMGQVWLGLIVVAGQIFTHVSQSRREIRQRTWLVEDREYVAKTADRLRTELLHEQARVAVKLDENTEISRGAAIAAKDAYHEANNVNMKLIAIGGARSDQKRRSDDK